jgi:hypothetical protein
MCNLTAPRGDGSMALPSGVYAADSRDRTGSSYPTAGAWPLCYSWTRDQPGTKEILN